MLVLTLTVPLIAGEKKKKDRGMLEKMEAVPCGAKERGFTGLGSIFASAGITAVNSTEKLCPQYLLRTDEMEYHIRPLDTKHPVILPIGHEGEFKIKKDHLYLKVPDGDHKTRPYQVVSIKPVEKVNSWNDHDQVGSKPTDNSLSKPAIKEQGKFTNPVNNPTDRVAQSASKPSDPPR